MYQAMATLKRLIVWLAMNASPNFWMPLSLVPLANSRALHLTQVWLATSAQLEVIALKRQ
jgi:hypothetical protein